MINQYLRTRCIKITIGIVLIAVWLIILNISCSDTLMEESVQITQDPLVQDDHLGLARSYAPFVFHEVHPKKGRQDLPTRVDFDGDMRGDNNWENFPYFSLQPTLYYAVLETVTYYFITFHIFHPRDWSWARIGIHLTHENDGENMQVVVDKATREVVLLFTQAHYRGGVYANSDSGFKGGKESIRGSMVLINEQGNPDPDGRHAAVFVEAYGHGIYGITDSPVVIFDDGTARFENGGIIFRPARDGEAVSEPSIDSKISVPYQLESISEKLWPGLHDGSLIGQGGLFDGAYWYEDAMVGIGVPRYYEADRFSGPFGPDRGISPFAVDFGFKKGTVGALFFDPANRYKELFQVPDNWSTTYLNYPFKTGDLIKQP